MLEHATVPVRATKFAEVETGFEFAEVETGLKKQGYDLYKCFKFFYVFSKNWPFKHERNVRSLAG